MDDLFRSLITEEEAVLVVRASKLPYHLLVGRKEKEMEEKMH